MAETIIQKKLQSAIKTITPSQPWSLLTRKIAYDATKYNYPIQYGTMRNTVAVYEPFIKAAIMYDSNELSSRGFRLVRQRGVNEIRTYLEARCDDDSSLVVGVHKRADGEFEFRASYDEKDVNGFISHTPVVSFKDMDSFMLTCCCLVLWPDILQIDIHEGNGRIRQACSDLVSGMTAVPPANWTSEQDIPDTVKESAYFLDAVLHIMQTKMVIHCGNDNSDTPEEIEQSWFNTTTGKLVGGLLTENSVDDWEPIVVASNGTTARIGGKCMTIADAKAEFASWSADRNWTPAEQQLIPKMPDDMPVMPEVLRIANRIVKTQNDKIPAVNFMWRGETGFGKSTGMQQLACILNTPFLTMTCHPSMEAQEFKSQFVPAEEPDDGIKLDKDYITVISPLVPFAAGAEFTSAMSYVNALDATVRDELFNDPDNFYELALSDQEEAEMNLYGKSVGCELPTLLSVYHRVGIKLKENLYEDKLKQAQAIQNGDTAAAKRGPDFRHVVSPYIKAMVNGYIVEVQEPSRIRDSGVLVSLNEFDRAGAVMQMLNCKNAIRHKKAIFCVTDNVGYSSCRPLDPSVIRRFAMVIDSYDLPKEVLFDRAKRNTGVTSNAILELSYKLWQGVREYCQHNSITEGSCSPVEFERFVQAVRDDGMDSIAQNLDECIIGKATSSIEDQRDIRAACTTLLNAA